MVRAILPIGVCVALAGCVSTSSKTFAELDRDHPMFHSESCQVVADDTRIHDELKLIRALASPLAVALSGGMLLPAVVVANVGFDAADRMDASRMEKHCGGQGKTGTEIAQGVVGGAAFGLATGSAMNAVSPVTIPSIIRPTPTGK